MSLRNVTITLPDATLRRARIYAAGHDMSLSHLVGASLERTIAGEKEAGAAWEDEFARMERGLLRVGDGALSRDEAHIR
ncbi:MAG: hypothetical protein LBR58_10260 [Propionibacteriaceae bacterium]|jgi:hypothetical protein|nr:hypothetical protein [Propionibacteriaceae bacterium]